MLSWPKKIIRFIKKLKSKIQGLEEENQLLKERIKDLQRRLTYYENAHTPPSARKLLKKKKQDTKKSSKAGKRGAPKGHRGATRPKPEPDETIDVIADECERCGSRNVQDLDEMKKCIIEDFLRPQEIEINQYNQHKMKCMDCGNEFISTWVQYPRALLRFITEDGL